MLAAAVSGLGAEAHRGRLWPERNMAGYGVHKVTEQGDMLEDARAIVTQFESLGGTGHGCEFGLFQRHFGAEPLGLLRWADLSPELLPLP